MPGRQEIPFPYVLDPGHALSLDEVSARRAGALFPGDRTRAYRRRDRRRPVDAATTAPARWRCSTGCAPISASRGCAITPARRPSTSSATCCSPTITAMSTSSSAGRSASSARGSRYTALSGAGGMLLQRGRRYRRGDRPNSAWRRHQMPAYHLMADDRTGITLVNIGVGPSNAKTICDHLAVLRPEAWLMIGHCGGLRPASGSATMSSPTPICATIMSSTTCCRPKSRSRRSPRSRWRWRARPRSCQRPVGRGTQAAPAHRHDRHHRRPQLGTALHPVGAALLAQPRGRRSTWNRATIAAQGYRFRVPYGTLLCVSDKPLHGELKLPGQANRFYERAIAEHMRIGIADVRGAAAAKAPSCTAASCARSTSRRSARR